MSNLSLIKNKQDVVYNIINNSLNEDKLAHAYLFGGVSGSLQYEAAILLAQTLVCESEGWACGLCPQCLRIQENTYPDLIILDGSEKTIKKEEVIDLQHRFSMTALEAASAKIFIVKDAHNMTSSAANSLLKFLEEPSDDVLGILISDDLESILPTIKSRCTILSFNALSYREYYNAALDKGCEARDAYYYSKVIHKYLSLDEFMEAESYQFFKEVFENFLDGFIQSPNRALVNLQNNLVKNTNKTLVNEVSKMFMDMLIVFLNDLMRDVTVDEYYHESCRHYRSQVNYLGMLEKVLEIKNKMANHINLALLMDQLFYEFSEVLS